MKQPAADPIFAVRQHIDWAKSAAKNEAYDEAMGHIERSRQAADQDEMLLNEINIAQADIKALLGTAIESVRKEIDELFATK